MPGHPVAFKSKEAKKLLEKKDGAMIVIRLIGEPQITYETLRRRGLA